MAELTPMMKQYFQIKEQYPDTILMFRLGDFYEMFFEDAKIASAVLELVLTGRDCGQEERAPMCGVPFHSVDSYIARLVAKGYKVAICEQLEDPALAKGIVKRDVTRVITPGTVIESTMLDEGKNNFLACICIFEKCVGMCFADVSTGSVHLTQFESKDAQRRMINELGRFMPSEAIFNSALVECNQVAAFLRDRTYSACNLLDDSCFDLSKACARVMKHFNVSSLSQLGIENCDGAVAALGATLDYLAGVQKNDLENIKEIDYYGDGSFMRLDVSALRNLEITETMRNRERKGSLLWVLDKTKTSMGKRMLRSWLEQPLLNVVKIQKRHNAVDELASSPIIREDLIEALTGCQDIERLITRIAYATANARELKALSFTLSRLPQIKRLLSSCESALLRELDGEIENLEEIAEIIDKAIVDEPPFTVREGGMINDGFNAELDELRDIINNGKGYIAEIQQREQERTGIKKLKIGYNRVFGYYIEVTNAFKTLVPEEYIRKQTLANCERYITQELKELESKVLGAQEKTVRLEYEIFESVRKKAAERLYDIQRAASCLATADVLCSFAKAAVENNYCRPEINTDKAIRITEGRHPVVEKMSHSPFVPNDTVLDCEENRCAIITGPNMAGKSTYMRQVALICLMAQAGSFVPASSAHLCIVDGIFTRIGASDDLSSGSSTFMVEMNEVADILRHATSQSLIIFDEIGRGTSTFDGMSIARAVLEFAADKRRLGAKTLFATHYHELTELESTVEGVKNYNVSVKKRGDDITFLRRIVSGCADGSYGIEVAKLAGVPNSVVERAKVVLGELEDGGLNMPVKAVSRQSKDEMQLSFGSSNAEEIVERLKMLDVNTLTPIEAMSVLYELSNKAK